MSITKISRFGKTEDGLFGALEDLYGCHGKGWRIIQTSEEHFTLYFPARDMVRIRRMFEMHCPDWTTCTFVPWRHRDTVKPQYT